MPTLDHATCVAPSPGRCNFVQDCPQIGTDEEGCTEAGKAPAVTIFVQAHPIYRLCIYFKVSIGYASLLVWVGFIMAITMKIMLNDV